MNNYPANEHLMTDFVKGSWFDMPLHDTSTLKSAEICCEQDAAEKLVKILYLA